MKRSCRQWLNLGALIITIALNGLANAIPFNGIATGEIADQFEIFFAPAGFTFAIWAVIYLALGAFAMYQFQPSQKDNPRLQGIEFYFAWSCLANSAWLIFWHFGIFHLTVVAMLALLALLSLIYLRIREPKQQPSGRETWFVLIPFSLYLAWISIASIANITDFLVFLGWNGGLLAEEVWAVIMIIAACGICALISLQHVDLVYVLVIVWALIGIASKQQKASPLVSNAAWIGAGIVILVWSAVYLQQRGSQGKKVNPTPAAE